MVLVAGGIKFWCTSDKSEREKIVAQKKGVLGLLS
jgi:hypothetical protein